MNPKIFGWQHLTFLAVYIVISCISLILLKIFVKKEKYQDLTIRIVGAILFSLLLWNRITLCLSAKNATYLIPDTFCGMTSLVLSLATIFGKRNNIVLHYVFYVSIVGCIATLVYPDFIGQNISIFYPKTISGLLHHALSLYLSILLCLFNWFVPNYKKSWALVVGFTCYITVGAFLISVLKLNDAFYIYNSILSGTPLNIWVIAPIFCALYLIFIISYEFIKRKIIKKKLKKETSPNK